eukprot:s2130_g4.t1
MVKRKGAEVKTPAEALAWPLVLMVKRKGAEVNDGDYDVRATDSCRKTSWSASPDAGQCAWCPGWASCAATSFRVGYGKCSASLDGLTNDGILCRALLSHPTRPQQLRLLQLDHRRHVLELNRAHSRSSLDLLHTSFCKSMCRALRSAAYFHVCKALLRCVVFCSLTYLHSSPALPNLQFASFGWTVARVPHAPAFAMGRAQRQLRESQRPGQQNRVETPASDETVEVEVEVETDGEEPRRESASGSRNDMGGSRNDMGGTTTQLSPSELRILDYMVWNTHKPPPKTVFLRPYIEAVRNASGSRPPLTAVGQDERLEEWTVPIDPRGHVHQAGSNTQIPDWHHDLLDFFAIPAAALHAEGLKGFYASGSGGDASSNLWVVGRASSDGKDVLPPKPVPKKRPVRPAHSQDESGVEFVHEVIQVDPAPEAPRQESPIPAYEVQLATPRAPGDLIASLLSTDADDKAFSGSDQTEMGPPQGKKTKNKVREVHRRKHAQEGRAQDSFD